MTACVNKKHSRRVALAISASLVGALSLGAAVPAVAFANDISTLEATDQSSINDGKIVSFKNGLESGHAFVANGKAQGLVPEKIQPWGTTAESAQVSADQYTILKIVDKDTAGAVLNTESTEPVIKGFRINGETFYYTEKLTNQLPDEIGEYAVFAYNAAARAHVNAGATFSIVAADLNDAELYEVDASDPDDLSDVEFVFDNANWIVDGSKLGVKIGDSQVSSSDYDVQYYDSSDKQIKGYPRCAGTYSVVLTGKNDYAGQKVKIPLNIDALDLSKASVVVPDVVKSATGVNQADLDKVTINSMPYGTTPWVYTLVDVEWTNLPTSTGRATVTFRADEKTLAEKGLDGSVINSIAVDYAVVDAAVPVKATYGTGNFDGHTLNTDFSATPTDAFDASKVAVSYTDPKTGKDVATEAYSLRVTDEDGNVGGTEMLANPGMYTVEVVLDAEGLSYQYCNQNTPKMTVNVTKGTIAITDIAFAYKGKIVEENDLTSGISYIPGANVLDDIDVTVKTANGEVAESDYEVIASKEVDGKFVEVDAIEGAGTYKVSVKADGYTYSEDEAVINVFVAKRDLEDADFRVKGTFDYSETVYDESQGKYVTVEHHVLPYTGDEVVPTFEWGVDVDNDGETEWFELPAADYEAKYSKTTSPANNNYIDLVKVGNYDADVAAKADSDNYEGTKWNVSVEVSDIRVFSDVPTTYWGAQAIYEAKALGLMGGYNDGSIFGPEDQTTRAQMAIVLYRLAGEPYSSDDEGHYSETQGWDTGFSDVDGNMYYSEAIAWAHSAGIVGGYGETGEFGPDDPITREQFAIMLANYAKACGDYKAPADADATLSAYSDGASVADWSRESVAWAVESGLMGQGVDSIWASDPISRAQVATMSVRYVDTFGAESIF